MAREDRYRQESEELQHVRYRQNGEGDGGGAGGHRGSCEDVEEDPLEAFVGLTDSVLRLKREARTYATSDIPILITGETGTGKELLARAIHALSSRKTGSFLPINCSAFSAHLAESELFGHETGAFSGAVREKTGLVRVADRGTLFLDEIGELAQEIQPKVLRLLQFGTFYPVGSEKEQQVDLRVVSATNRPLEKDGDQPVVINGLRRDLLYRLNAVHLHIPPLRERIGDIPMLLAHRARQRGLVPPPFSEDAQRMLRSYPFPGNVRELENLADKLFLQTGKHTDTSPPVSAEVLQKLLHPNVMAGCAEAEPAPPFAGVPGNLAAPGPGHAPFSLEKYLNGIERTIISQALEEHSGNVSRTARALGLSRQGLKNKMRRYGLSV